jgi:hypothetical protein
MEFERQCNEFTGNTGAPPGQKECLMRSAACAWGVIIVMAECRMKLRCAKPRPRSAYPVEQPIHAEHCRTGREENSLE